MHFFSFCIKYNIYIYLYLIFVRVFLCKTLLALVSCTAHIKYTIEFVFFLDFAMSPTNTTLVISYSALNSILFQPLAHFALARN